MAARTASVVTIFIGALWAVLGLIYAQPYRDFGIGVAVAAAGVTGLGLCDWLKDRP